jgi:hypothetical protein
MNKCNECQTRTILMSVVISLEADEQPYNSDKYEKVEHPYEQEVNFSATCQYCPKCEEIGEFENKYKLSE